MAPNDRVETRASKAGKAKTNRRARAALGLGLWTHGPPCVHPASQDFLNAGYSESSIVGV